MSTFKQLLAPTDFSEYAMMAVRRAAMIAVQQQAKLDLMHVLSSGTLKSLQEFEFLNISQESEAQQLAEAEHQLAALAADIKRETGITPATQIKAGNVLDEVIAAMKAADMLVLGARGTSPLRDLLVGSMAMRLLGKCNLPVLVVNGAPTQIYRRVLVPVDFFPHSREALKLALQIAPDADITVINAFQVPFKGKLALSGAAKEQLQRYRTQAQQLASQNIQELIQEVAGESHQIKHAVKQADPAVFILEQATELEADLIVIGKRGQSLMEGMLLGSVTRHILVNVKCDVLAVHPA
ncbi:MAG: universal stress protein [Methylobacillus sp.]|jgi:nucleotide-binding universal stress UspA family protein|nr:universal stress protein [Methylobacillus sp.]